MVASEDAVPIVLAGGSLENRRLVLFFRDFVQFFGGHLKVWHYFEHVRHSPHHTPVIAFSERTLWDATNPWSQLRSDAPVLTTPPRPDVLFIAGLDWLRLTPADRPRSRIPIINLIQHVRHGDRDDPRHDFLSHRAIRICVSAEVGAALRATRRVNGPIHVIPNGLDLTERGIDRTWTERAWDVVIVAGKAPELGAMLFQTLAQGGRRVHLVDSWRARPEFLNTLSEGRVAVLLPHRAEGFYLPALEAMAAGALVVCPDCIGNRSFCLAGRNCQQPEYTPADIIDKTLALLALAPGPREAMLEEARRTVEQHDLMGERRAFLDILESAERTW